MRTLGIDIETYSSKSIKYGVYSYVGASDFTVLLFAYSIDGAEPEIVDFAHGEKLPEYVLKALYDPAVLKTAYNANFEITCLSRYLDKALDPKQWECTSVLALSLGLPGSLAAVGKALGLPEDKQKMAQGKELIQIFCRPRADAGLAVPLLDQPAYLDDGARWRLFKEYSLQDVVTEQEIRRKLVAWKPSEREHDLWTLDQQINGRGVLVDTEFAEGAVECGAEVKAEAMARLRQLTRLRNPNSREQLKAWLEKQLDTEIPALDKAWVAEALKQDLPRGVREVLGLKQLIAKSSLSKYETMLAAKSSDDRVRGMLQFYGAATGRWAGRIVQVHNLPQNHIDDLDTARAVVKARDVKALRGIKDNPSAVLSELIRTAFIAKPGHTFIVADYSAIEARVIAWLAKEGWRQEVFARNGDIYCASASQMFKVPVEKHGVNSHLRQKGKIAELALGYQGSVGALKAMGADKLGISEEELQGIVDRWRKASPAIVRFWRTAEDNVKAVIRAGTARTVRNLRFEYDPVGSRLFIMLPSGRRLAYNSPRIRTVKGEERLLYMGTGLNGTWCEIETYGGKLVENIVQATARDCLGHAMLRLAEAGYNIVMHIHDEVVIEAPTRGAEESLSDVIDIMCKNEAWAKGLTLNADGYVTPYYKKE